MRARLAAMAAVGALALGAGGCGDSPEDTAHDNGKAIGTALRDLTDARSAQEIQAATTKLKDAVGNVSDDVSKRVRDQAAVQRNSIEEAVANVGKAATSTDPTAQAAAKDALQSDIADLRSQAGSFSKSNDSVTNSFWEGVKDGYDD